MNRHRYAESDTTERLNWTELNIYIHITQCMTWILVSFLCGCCSVAQSCLTFATPWPAARQASLSFSISQSLLKLMVHWVGDAIQPPHPLSSPSPPAFNLSQHQGLFQWVCSSHQVANVMELQLQHQSFQWIFRVGFHEDWLVWYHLRKGMALQPS